MIAIIPHLKMNFGTLGTSLRKFVTFIRKFVTFIRKFDTSNPWAIGTPYFSSKDPSVPLETIGK